MTITRNKLLLAMQTAVIGTAGFTATFSPALLAQQNSEDAVQEVVVIGSAIKRKDLEGALPIQVLTEEALARTGVVTTTELMDKIPAMQGFTTVGDSVGGGGGGIRTASIHSIGESYTLVLLNGRRMAPADSGSAIDISAIPMSMLQQVDVLTDGAGALYGSDAIAGVVNFQLKKEVTETTVNLRYSDPTAGAGESSDIDIITGFGSLADDGYALVAGFNHHDQKQLAARDRDFAKTGIIKVTDPKTGKAGIFFNGSGNAIPGNATITFIDPSVEDDPDTEINESETSRSFNPYQVQNGSCAEHNFQVGTTCQFDHASTIEIVPESTTDSLFLNGHYKVNDDLTAYSTLVYSENSVTSRIAPYPTGNVPIPLDSALVTKYILPYITPVEAENLLDVSGTWRALPAEGRTAEYLSDAIHLVLGFEGKSGDIDYSGAYTYGKNSQEQNYPTGWLLGDPFVELVSSGGLDIFTTPDNISDTEKEALAKTVYHGPWDSSDMTIHALEGQASKPLFELNGGNAVLAAGFDARKFTYERGIAEANENETILFLSTDTPYDMSRSQWALFSELLLPLTEKVELTASVRYDEIDAVDSEGFGKIGEKTDDTTYKLSGRWKVTDEFSFRASFGTGFKAPSLLEVAEPRTEFGVTSGDYLCPFDNSDPYAAYCLPGEFQPNVYRQGNAELQPETSEQSTVGFVFAPNKNLSLTVDYWKVEITDVVERLTEEKIFADPDLYRDLFTYKTNLATDKKELAIIQAAVNGGKFDASGIDYTLSHSFALDVGTLTASLTGTYMLESESTLNGSSLGKFGGDEIVTFRNQINVGLTLDQKMFTHSISVNYKSGYTDQAQTYNLIDANGDVDYSTDTDIQLDIPSYYTVNWQSKLKLLDDKLGLTLGVNNLLDEDPPLSLRTNGAGHQVGYDPRYADSYGRTVFLQASYKF
ncbi:MAG: TonB-dependent receptor [Gammaproteobacteria bacterium]|nr:MAG: TonB-dependent receptor [Gammaproteobacteria bacterium]